MGEHNVREADGHDHSLSWLASQLRAPTLPAHYVRRPRLLTLLDAVVERPIALVVAPAGSGKSSLLADWAATCPEPPSWLRLDDGVADASQLWAGLAAALARFAPQLADLARPRRRQGEQLLRTILERLEEGPPARAVLVIDDVQVLDDDSPAAAALQTFLQALPPWLHVVLLSRRTLPLPVERLRVRGQLDEIRFPQLRFTPAEAVKVMTRLAPVLGIDEANSAAVAADGWIAGLQLTALAARTDRSLGPEARPLDGTALLITDYVLNEVLVGERPEVVQVLVDTSVVARTNASLATALTGRDDAGALLLEAERRGLFVTRLGVSGWFETHAMVREILLRQVTEESPRRVAGLHLEAANWLERSGEVVAALQQWLRADRPRETLRALATHAAALYDQGLEETIAHTMEHIPPRVAASSLEAAVEHAWCLLLVDRRRFVRAVDQATAMAERIEASDSVLGGLHVLAAIRALVVGDWAGSSAAAEAAARLLGEDYWLDPLGRFVHNLIARVLALDEVWDEGGIEVRRCELGVARDPERQLALESTRALGQVLAGHPLDALRSAAGFRAATDVANLSLMRIEFCLAEALAHRELGDRRRAAEELRALTGPASEPMTYAHVYAFTELTEHHLDAHELDAAAECFEQVRRFATTHTPGAGAGNRLARTGSRLALAAGDVATAMRWADRIDDAFWAPVSRAKVHLASGRPRAARDSLAQAVPRCLRHRVVHALMAMRATQVDASGGVTSQDDLEFWQAAVAAGLFQTVATEVSSSPVLLEALAGCAPAEWVDRLRRTTGSGGGGVGIGVVEPPWPGERLTARELDVLRMLPSRLTQSEIAEELGVSVNTVKYHVKVVYRKLGVASRSEAATAAARMARARPHAQVPGPGHASTPRSDRDVG